MSDKNTIDKINKIFKYFIDDKVSNSYSFKKYKAKLWNIDTNQFSTIKRLYQNIKIIKDDIVEIKIIKIINKNENDKFSMFINNINITPTILKDKICKKSAIRQYLQFWYCLGIIEFNADFYKEDISYIQVNANFKNTIEEIANNNNHFINGNDFIIDLIYFNFKSNLEFARNLSYSIFILSLYKFDKSIFNKIDSNYTIIMKKCNKDGKKYLRLNSAEANDYLDKMIKETYKEMLSNIKQDNLLLFIDHLFNMIEEIELKDNNIELGNILSNITKLESKFKKNVFENRKNNKLIYDEKDLYSDVIEIDGEFNKIPILDQFNISNACHIYERHQIKKYIKDRYYEGVSKDIINSISMWISDPNNCIIMNTQLHDLFDRRIFNFNIKGEMISSSENHKYLFITKNIPKIRIKSEVFNNQMKEFLIKRTFYS